MDYTKLSPEFLEEYYKKFDLTSFSMKKAKLDASIFAYFILGIKPYPYQDYFLNSQNKRLAICSSRQIGKSLSISIRALHEALFNERHNVVIVNPSLEQSFKLMQGIKDLIHVADEHMRTYGKHYIKFLSNKIDKTRTNNSSQISFKNGSVIKSVPATSSARGNTAHLVLVDEAGFMEDEIFEEIILPMVTHTEGKIILSSTPNGPKGFFYKYFDPEDKLSENPYKRFWFHWTICDEQHVRNTVLEAKKTMDSLSFEQEYEAKFTSSKTSFFTPETIDRAVTGYQEYRRKDRTCWCGIDWGLKTCKTVVSVGSLNHDTGKFELHYIKVFEAGFENHNIIPFLEQLMKDFNIEQIISDDGPIAVTVNQMLEESGFPLIKFDFNKDKISGYMNLREWLEQGKIVLFNDKSLIEEMKALVFERKDNGRILIHKPQTGNDDIIDSVMMCFSPAVLENVEVGLMLV